MEWISVKDRLPDIDEFVAVRHVDSNENINYDDFGYGRIINNENDWYVHWYGCYEQEITNCDVTHWMIVVDKGET